MLTDKMRVIADMPGYVKVLDLRLKLHVLGISNDQTTNG